MHLLITIVLDQLRVRIHFRLHNRQMELLLVKITNFNQTVFTRSIHIDHGTTVRIRFIIVDSTTQTIQVTRHNSLCHLLSGFGSALVILVPANDIFKTETFTSQFYRTFPPYQFTYFGLCIIFRTVNSDMTSAQT